MPEGGGDDGDLPHDSDCPAPPISSGSAGKGAVLRARLVGNTEPMLFFNFSRS